MNCSNISFGFVNPLWVLVQFEIDTGNSTYITSCSCECEELGDLFVGEGEGLCEMGVVVVDE